MSLGSVQGNNLPPFVWKGTSESDLIAAYSDLRMIFICSTYTD